MIELAARGIPRVLRKAEYTKPTGSEFFRLPVSYTWLERYPRARLAESARAPIEEYIRRALDQQESLLVTLVESRHVHVLRLEGDLCEPLPGVEGGD